MWAPMGGWLCPLFVWRHRSGWGSSLGTHTWVLSLVWTGGRLLVAVVGGGLWAGGGGQT